jgi:hypothetical protein
MYLRAELTALDRQSSARRDADDVTRALDIMREALTDWQKTLRQEPPEARRALRALLAGRLVFAPHDGAYAFEGPGTITPVLAGVVGMCAKGVVAPTGFARRWTWADSPWPGWRQRKITLAGIGAG